MFSYVDGRNGSTVSRKRKRCSSQSKTSKCEMPLEERLKEVLAGASAASGDTSQEIASTKAEELVISIVKGLHASDAKLVDKALNTTNLETVQSVAQRLPVQCLLPLVQELTQRIRSKIDVRLYIRWLHILLATHSTYMSSVPEIVDELCSQHQLFESRVNMMDRFLRLQGRLDLLLEQFKDTSQPYEPRQLSEQAAKAVYVEGADNEISDEEFQQEEDYMDDLLENDEYLAVSEGELNDDSENGDQDHSDQGKNDEADEEPELNGYSGEESKDDDETSDL